MSDPQVWAASSPLRARFTPTFFLPKSSWLCHVVPSSKELASGRGPEEAGRPEEGRAQLATAGADSPCLSHAPRILL